MSGTYESVKIERSTALLVAVLLFLSLVICEGVKSSPEIQITNDPHDQTSPSISGSYVVWEDNRNDNDDIYGFNLKTGQEFQITDDPSDQTHPSISGSYVVWEDNRNGNADIYGYSLETQEEFRITWDSSNQKYPEISGTLVVWQDDRHYTNWEIYGCDLSRNEEIRITENGYDQKYPRVSGNIVVWMDKRNGKDAVYGYDLSSNREFRVCKDTYPCEMAPSGNTVVFLEWVHSDGLIGVYNVSTSRTVEIEVADDGMDIDFEGNIIVWAEMSLHFGSDLGSGIFGYDLSTDRLLSISSGRGTRMCPRIYGDTVVWEYYRNGNWDIYGSSIEGVPFDILHPRPPYEYYYGILTALSVLGAYFLGGVHLSQRHIEDAKERSLELHKFRRSLASSIIWFGFGTFWNLFGFLQVYGMNLLVGFVFPISSFLYFTKAFWHVRTPYFLITRNGITLFENVSKRPRVIEWDDIQNTLANFKKNRIDLLISDDQIVRIRVSELDKKSEDTLLRILPTVFPFVKNQVV